MKKALPILMVLSFLCMPSLSHAKLVPECGKGPVFTEADKANSNIPEGKHVGDFVNGDCDFNKVMELVNNVITFLLFTFATPIAAVVFAYAGFILITSGGNTEAKSRAKTAIKNVLIGYVVALAAWLIVKTILVTLGFNGPMFL